jgi:hypothetical protein
VVVQTVGLVAQALNQRTQPFVLRDFGRLRQHRCRSDDRGQRRPQFVRHRTDERFAQAVRLLPRPCPPRVGGKLSRHHGDDDEQRQIEDVNGIVDAEIVDRRIEEEGGCANRGESRDHGRYDAAPDRGKQHRDHVNDGDGPDIDKALQGRERAGQHADQHQRDHDLIGALARGRAIDL